ncbi:glycoside hydrolase family 13 protein [Butyrivibrio sp. AE2032]|uniref:glycoside hydrolase family 13 protein n=1 Tax=Butyrivibrio sp. AE2032 TaxID=1458463 RepID=UPI00068EE3D1|nr:glycoside hydrolase family 13 protein [Butyrivibrio sp. AE2032]
MIKAAIMHEATREYCYCVAPDTFKIRIVTAKDDVKGILLHGRDKYLSLDISDTRFSIPMVKIASDDIRDYFEVEVKMNMLCLRYYFEITDNHGHKVFFGDDQLLDYEPTDIEEMFDCPQSIREEGIALFPKWAEGKVVYQIFPSRFATSKYVSEEQWYKAPIEWNDKLCGDLWGIINKLDYLKELGVDIVYLTPIFKANTEHKYDTVDYYQVDPDFGGNEALKELVEQIHKRGMYIMLDGVFNHTSDKFFAFEDVLKNGEESQYKDWYFIDSFPLDRGSKERKPNYKTFGYYGGMPKLNLTNKDALEYVKGVICHYLADYGIDGWRLDVADEIGHKFWKEMRIAAKAIKPDALIVGEDWHICADFLEGDEWDSCMNYAWFKALGRLYGGNGPIHEFVSKLGQVRGRYHSDVFPLLWNLMDSHDTKRFLSYACEEGGKGKMLSAAALTMLFPGCPFIYYGDEVGMAGDYDPDNRRGMLWDTEKYADPDMLDAYKRLAAFRHEHEELWKEIPEVVFIDEVERVMAFKQDKLVMIFNLKENQVDLKALNGHLNAGINMCDSEGGDGPELIFKLSAEKEKCILGAYDVAVFSLA